MKMKIPFVDLQPEHRLLRREIDGAIGTVIDNGQFVLGEQVEEFESAFAAYCDSRFCVGVSSGTAALHLALLASGVGRGDEVITVPNTFVATVEAIIYTGATPVFVDVDSRTANMDVGKIGVTISSKTKAIVPVHLYGQFADMLPIASIAEANGISVIEDACQAHGAGYADSKTFRIARPGSFNNIACFSFYPSKNLGAFGDGGAIVTSNESLYDMAVWLRNHGQVEKNHSHFVGFNYRLDSLQASVLSVKLPHVNGWNGQRQTVADLYDTLLLSTKLEPLETMHYVQYHSHHLYVAVAPTQSYRDGLRTHLSGKGISTGIHYPIPIHMQRGFSSLGYKAGDFPVAEKLGITIISLPIYPSLSEEQVKYVVSSIREFEND